MAAERQVTDSFEFATLLDVPYYFEEYFAWSQEERTTNVMTEPTPNSGWAQSIAAQGSWTYLWRKVIRHVLNPATNTYTTEDAQYFRQNGTDGTSIHTKGNVDYQNSSQGSGTALNLISNPSDGDAYVVNLDLQGNEGWLYQWAAESNSWIPLGQFRGEPGKTYYSHIVWATNIVYSGSTVTRVDGYTPAKSPNDTTHFWMGTYIDETAQDPVSGSDPILLQYTWSYTKGAKGDGACVMSAAPNILSWNTDVDDRVVSMDAKDVTWAVHQGEEEVSGNLSDGHSPLPLGFTAEEISSRVYRITPHEYYQPFSGDNGPVYVMGSTYSNGDAVYSTNGDYIGTVSNASSGGFTCSSPNSMYNGKTYTNPSVVRTTLTQPATVFLYSLYGDFEGRATVVIMPNKQGQSNITLDLDNQHDAIMYSGATKIGADASTHARLLIGGVDKTSEVTAWSLDDTSSCTAARVGSTNEFKVTAIASGQTKGVLIIRATRDGQYYYGTFTVDKLVDKPKYELSINKPVVSANTDETSAASDTIQVRVYKTTANSTGEVTRTLVTNLSNEGLKLWQTDGSHQPEQVQDGTGSGKYNNGLYTFTAFFSRSSAYFWLTNSQATYTTLEANMYDSEVVPIVTVQNGQQGDPGPKGDAARQPYEWGTWADFIADNNNTFTANKYETPFFIVEKEEKDQHNITMVVKKKYQWVGDDGEYVPPSATPGTGQKRSTTPGSDENWEEMWTDLKYLISEAQMADYGKFGSGIFNKDYAFSQYGVLDGNSLDHYKNFRPEFFKGQPYTLFQGSKVLFGNVYNSESAMYSFGEIFLEHDINYTFNFTFNALTSLVNIRLFDLETNQPIGGWQIGMNESRQTDPGAPYDNILLPGGHSYLVCAYLANSGSQYSANFASITVEASKAFKPNFYIDWLQGEVYAQLGRFVNVTVEGAINNLVTEINFATGKNVYNKDTNPNGVAFIYPNEQIDSGNILGITPTRSVNEISIDLERTGNVIKFVGTGGNARNIYLPMYVRENTVLRYIRPNTLYNNSSPQPIYVEDLRRLAGRRFTFINESTSAIRLVFGAVIVLDQNDIAYDNTAANQAVYRELLQHQMTIMEMQIGVVVQNGVYSESFFWKPIGNDNYYQGGTAVDSWQDF